MVTPDNEHRARWPQARNFASLVASFVNALQAQHAAKVLHLRKAFPKYYNWQKNYNNI